MPLSGDSRRKRVHIDTDQGIRTGLLENCSQNSLEKKRTIGKAFIQYAG